MKDIKEEIKNSIDKIKYHKDRFRHIELTVKSNEEPIETKLFQDIVILNYEDKTKFDDITTAVDEIMRFVNYFNYSSPIGCFLKKHITLILTTSDYRGCKKLTKVINDCNKDQILSFICTII